MQDSHYVGALTFVVDESSASGGGMGSVFGKLGFGSLNPSGVNLDRIIEFSKSEYVTKQVLDDTIRSEQQESSLADYLVGYYEMPERWQEAENSSLLGFSGMSSPINLNDRTESRVFQLLHAGMQRGIYGEDPLLQLSYNAATGIFRLVATTKAEELSYTLCNSMYENLKNLYTAQAGEKDAIVVKVLNVKQDSLKNRLDDLTASYNRELDKNTRVILSQNKQRLEAYEREIFQTTTLLREVVQNAELTRFRLLTITPAFKTIDTPHYPLGRTNISKTRYLLAGLFLGAFMTFVFFLSKAAYKEHFTPAGKEI